MALQDMEVVLGGGGLLVLVMTLIQIAPIKINPWTWLARKFGQAINAELITKIDKLEKNVDGLRAECEERDATLSRTHILRFGDEILHGTSHSYEHFLQVMRDIDAYEDYCDEHPGYLNNVADVTIDLIRKTYKECFDKKNFL